MPPKGIPRKKKKKKEIDPFLDTVCPFRASRVINVPICSYEEEKKKEIDPFLDTVCPLRASRVISGRKPSKTRPPLLRRQSDARGHSKMRLLV